MNEFNDVIGYTKRIKEWMKDCVGGHGWVMDHL